MWVEGDKCRQKEKSCVEGQCHGSFALQCKALGTSLWLALMLAAGIAAF